MISVDEMKRILAKEYDIHNDADLDEALRRVGGINIAVFVTERGDVKKKE